MTTTISSATHNVKRYTLEDFERIKYSNILFKLSPAVLAKIQHIATEVGSPEYIKTPQFPKKDKYMRKKMRNYKPQMLSEEDWKQIREFKATVIKKNEGIEAIIDKIRQHLNKISTKTYDTLSVKIFDEIEHVMKESETSENNNESLKQICTVIFDIASSNAFYSELYARFYKNLLDNKPIMRDILLDKFNDYLKLFENIENVDPAKDYNKFCEVNKVNEKRRAIIKFYVNLMKNDVITTQKIFDIINKIKNSVELNIEKKEKIFTVDELSELFKIIIIEGHVYLMKDTHNWEEIKNYIDTMANTSASSKDGLSNKTVFKYMDIQDALNK